MPRPRAIYRLLPSVSLRSLLPIGIVGGGRKRCVASDRRSKRTEGSTLLLLHDTLILSRRPLDGHNLYAPNQSRICNGIVAPKMTQKLFVAKVARPESRKRMRTRTTARCSSIIRSRYPGTTTESSATDRPMRSPVLSLAAIWAICCRRRRQRRRWSGDQDQQGRGGGLLSGLWPLFAMGSTARLLPNSFRALNFTGLNYGQ